MLVHGLAASAWVWAPVARRLIAARRTVAMDLRGHGLSDAPTDDGAYDLDVLADDVVAVAEGSGLLDAAPAVTLAGHGFGAIVAAAAAARPRRPLRPARPVDGGLDDLPATTGLDVDEFLRGLDEPPEVMRSMAAYLADRRGWDPSTLGRRPGAGRPRRRRRDAGRAARVGDPAARPRRRRPDDVRGTGPTPSSPGVSAPIVAVRRITPGDERRAGRRSAAAGESTVVELAGARPQPPPLPAGRGRRRRSSAARLRAAPGAAR